MKKNIPQRQQFGEKYYFIDLRTLKHCYTQDHYFFTDYEKHRAGNYFITKAAVEAAEDQLNEKFGTKLSRLESAREKNDRALIRDVLDIPSRYKLSLVNANDEGAVAKLLSVINLYESSKRKISEEIALCNKQISDFILSAKKK